MLVRLYFLWVEIEGGLMQKTVILTQQMRRLLEEHQQCEVSLIAETGRLAPNPDVVGSLKRRKLAIKDQMQRLATMLPPSQYAPIDPMLYALSDEELQKRRKDAERRCRRAEGIYGPTASELVKVRAECRALEIETDRRAWEAASTVENEQLEAA